MHTAAVINQMALILQLPSSSIDENAKGPNKTRRNQHKILKDFFNIDTNCQCLLEPLEICEKLPISVALRNGLCDL